MSASQNKIVVQQIYDALERGDSTVFATAVHADYVWRIAGQASWSRRFEGREAIQRDLFAPLFGRFATRYRARAASIIAEGDRVVAEVRGEVTTKTGEAYNNEYCFVFRFRDGKISEVVEYGDTDLEERVLGRYEDTLESARNSQ